MLSRWPEMLPKIVWMLWLQGWHKAPDLIRACALSWKTHNPGWTIHFLDAETLSQFVEIANPNAFSAQASDVLSDIVRNELLVRYGGVWADATTYCLRPLDEWIDVATETGFFAFNRPAPDRMLANWFLAAHQDNYIPTEWLKRSYAFWQGRKERDPYFWHHLLFAQAYRDDVTFRRVWDDTPKISAELPHCFVPSSLNLFAPPSAFHRLVVETAQTSVLKLTHRLDHSLGKPGTAYHWLCERFMDGKVKSVEGRANKPAKVVTLKPLTESDVNSEKFDQPLGLTKTKLIICSTPRSGSYMLCRAMIHHGIGVPHEYLNGLNARTIAPRLAAIDIATHELEVDSPARRRYVAALIEHRTVNGVFAIKIQGGQFAQYFKRSLSVTPIFEDAYYIHIYREDLLAQAISFHISLLTGRWGPDNTVTTRAVPNPQFFDRAAIENRLQILADQDKEWRLAFARHGIAPLSLTYEGIKDDLPGALRRIVSYAKIELPSSDFNYGEAHSDFRNPSEPTKSEIRRWFLGARS